MINVKSYCQNECLFFGEKYPEKIIFTFLNVIIIRVIFPKSDPKIYALDNHITVDFFSSSKNRLKGSGMCAVVGGKWCGY